MTDLTEPQTARVAALDNVLHLFRGQRVADMPDTAHDVQLLNAALYRKGRVDEIRYEEPMRP